MQEQMGRPALKLIQEVDTRWNNTFQMLQCVHELREPIGAPLAGLHTDICPLSSEQYDLMAEWLKILSPFNDATTELSEEKRVSGSKVIPLLTMLHHALHEEEMGVVLTPESSTVVENLRRQLKEKLYTLQSMSIMSLATLLDPRLKKTGFFSLNKAMDAEKRLIFECAAFVQHLAPLSAASSAAASSSKASQPVTQGI